MTNLNTNRLLDARNFKCDERHKNLHSFCKQCAKVVPCRVRFACNHCEHEAVQFDGETWGDIIYLNARGKCLYCEFQNCSLVSNLRIKFRCGNDTPQKCDEQLFSFDPANYDDDATKEQIRRVIKRLLIDFDYTLDTSPIRVSEQAIATRLAALNVTQQDIEQMKHCDFDTRYDYFRTVLNNKKMHAGEVIYLEYINN